VVLRRAYRGKNGKSLFDLRDFTLCDPFFEHKCRINRGIPVYYLLFIRTSRFNENAVRDRLHHSFESRTGHGFFASLCAVRNNKGLCDRLIRHTSMRSTDTLSNI
jgi:hypothetical protein